MEPEKKYGYNLSKEETTKIPITCPRCGARVTFWEKNLHDGSVIGRACCSSPDCKWFGQPIKIKKEKQ